MTKHRTKEDRKTQILDAAIACFAKNGYYETTMDHIVQAAGLSKGALYWYFKSKKVLFRALVELWFAEILEGLAPVMAQAKSAEEKLICVVDSTEKSASAQPELARAMLEFFTLATRDSELQDWLVNVYVDYYELVKRLIDEGIAGGEFRAVDSGQMARMILAYIDGVQFHREIFPLDSEASPTLGGITRMLLNVVKVENNGRNKDTARHRERDAAIPD